MGSGIKLIVQEGDKYNYLTIIKEDGKGTDGRMFICECKCGNKTRVSLHSMRRGNTGSCGCFQVKQIKKANTKHGLSRAKIYKVWEGIQKRCNYKKSDRYKDYGGRGIKCEWDRFEDFYKDMGDKPEGLTIDRINNDGNYSESNCRWASNKEQQNNKRNNRYITYNGKIQTMKQWSEELGIKYNLINTRINTYGWSIEKSFNY